MGFYTELENLDVDELKLRFERKEEEDEYGAIYYEEIVKHLLTQGIEGISYLKRIVEEAQIDVPQLRAAICMLSFEPQGPWYRKKLQALLQDSREFIVAEAIDSLASTQARDLSEDILRLLAHPSPYVRGSVLRYMRKLFPKTAAPMLLAALKDAHPLVRENAIDELGDLGYYQAIPAIRPLLYHQPEPVRQAARTAVKNLTIIKKLEHASAKNSEDRTD